LPVSLGIVFDPVRVDLLVLGILMENYVAARLSFVCVVVVINLSAVSLTSEPDFGLAAEMA
jgi:hypothetical protein